MYDPITHLPLKYDTDGHPVTDDKSGGVEYFTLGTDGTIPATNGQDADDTTDNETEDPPF